MARHHQDTQATPDDLLASLARDGEPSAFLTLFGPLVTNDFVSMVTKGISPADASGQLQEFCAALYRDFVVAESGGASITEWHDKRLSQAIPSIAQSGDAVNSETPPSQAQLDSLNSGLYRRLCREYRELRDRSGKRGIRDKSRLPATVVAPILLTLAALLAAVVASVAVLQFYWQRTGTVLDLTISTVRGRSSFAFPLSVHRTSTPATDTTTRSYSATPDSNSVGTRRADSGATPAVRGGHARPHAPPEPGPTGPTAAPPHSPSALGLSSPPANRVPADTTSARKRPRPDDLSTSQSVPQATSMSDSSPAAPTSAVPTQSVSPTARATGPPDTAIPSR
jgi:hypothetical protein